MINDDNVTRFERLFLPHMSAAYNLARWLTKSDSVAQEVVQDSYLRTFRALHRSGNARVWLLNMVRNCSYSWLRESPANSHTVNMDETAEWSEADRRALLQTSAPEVWAMRLKDSEKLQQVLMEMPPALREVVILKELEGMCYKEIAAVTETPIGTVMARLARAREMLKARMQQP